VARDEFVVVEVEGWGLLVAWGVEIFLQLGRIWVGRVGDFVFAVTRLEVATHFVIDGHSGYVPVGQFFLIGIFRHAVCLIGLWALGIGID